MGRRYRILYALLAFLVPLVGPAATLAVARNAGPRCECSHSCPCETSKPGCAIRAACSCGLPHDEAAVTPVPRAVMPREVASGVALPSSRWRSEHRGRTISRREPPPDPPPRPAI